MAHINKELNNKAKRIIFSIAHKYLELRNLAPKAEFVAGKKGLLRGKQQKCIKRKWSPPEGEDLIIYTDASLKEGRKHGTMAMIGLDASFIPKLCGMAWVRDARTNKMDINKLELKAVAWGLTESTRACLEATKITVLTDSLSVVQLHKADASLARSYLKRKEQTVTIDHQPRLFNQVADHLAKRAGRVQPDELGYLKKRQVQSEQSFWKFWKGFHDQESFGIWKGEMPKGVKKNLLRQRGTTTLEIRETEIDEDVPLHFPTMNDPKLKLHYSWIKDMINEWVQALADGISEKRLQRFVFRHKTNQINEELIAEIAYHNDGNENKRWSIDKGIKKLHKKLETFNKEACSLPNSKFNLQLIRQSHSDGWYDAEVELPAIEVDLGGEYFGGITISFKIVSHTTRLEEGSTERDDLSIYKRALEPIEEFDLPREFGESRFLEDGIENEIFIRREEWGCVSLARDIVHGDTETKDFLSSLQLKKNKP